MFRIKIKLGDITEFEGDAIVNAANEQLSGGEGVDGAIHRAAGPQLLEECQTLGGCEVGEAKITGGYNLKAKYVIHTVGPMWEGGGKDEEDFLENCYTNSLRLAEEHQIRTMAFPAISTGAYDFPKDPAAQVAIRTTKRFLKTNELPEQVTFICFDEVTLTLYEKILDMLYGEPDPLTLYESILDMLNEEPDPRVGTSPEVMRAKRDKAWEIITSSPMNILAAAYTGNTPQLKKYLEAGVSKDVLANAIRYAREGGNEETVKQCDEADADNEKTGDSSRKEGGKGEPAPTREYTIHEAAKWGIIEVVRAFLATGVHEDEKESENSMTPLHLAVAHGRKEVAELLIEQGANVDEPDKRDWTPLHYAAHSGHKGIVELLIGNDANINAMETGEKTPLDKAHLRGHYKVAELLRRRGGKTGEELKPEAK